MTRKILLRPAARADLAEIWSFGVSRWGRAQTEAYLNGLDDLMRLLCDYPEISRLHEEFRPPVRLHPYRAHLVVYRSEISLEVLRVPSMRSNWRMLVSE